VGQMQIGRERPAFPVGDLATVRSFGHLADGHDDKRRRSRACRRTVCGHRPALCACSRAARFELRPV
jgi:hypothetical protein